MAGRRSGITAAGADPPAPGPVRPDSVSLGRGPASTGRPSFIGAVNRYHSHIVYIDVLSEVSVMPARGAQSC